MGIGNVTKAATFTLATSLKLQKHTISFFETALFNYFHEANINR